MPALEARLGDCPLRKTEGMRRKQLRGCHQEGVCSGFCRGVFGLPRVLVGVGETGVGQLQAHPWHKAMEDSRVDAANPHQLLPRHHGREWATPTVAPELLIAC